MVCPCSGLNIDWNDVTDSPEVKHGSARDFIKFVNIINNNIKQDRGISREVGIFQINIW